MTELLNKFSSLKVNIIQIRQDLQTVIEKVNCNHSELAPEADFLQIHEFPLKEKHELEVVEKYLQNEENYRRTVSTIQTKKSFMTYVI